MIRSKFIESINRLSIRQFRIELKSYRKGFVHALRLSFYVNVLCTISIVVYIFYAQYTMRVYKDLSDLLIKHIAMEQKVQNLKEGNDGK
jgi:hypothetical protein